ncbi:ribosome recycling factor [Photobacterium frigidiphilum]|uniref:Ribosome recycling factor n=1 Tax=Photobacterium frigidiphilum TaxID=264736 RepID=A0A2T3J8F0_9GAMM|nr:ribosome recycling factor family protein [Photobacterium frigidiphilum]PSU45034.1 ribosome recycling factor [Photobacterium frigidiphilum]
MTDKTITTLLPSLIHRIGSDNTKKSKLVALECGCEIKRIRRSRNWQITGNENSYKLLSERLKLSEPDAMQFLIRKIDDKLTTYNDKLERIEDKLKRLVLKSPNITLAELMQITNCSITEARFARFDADSF